MSVANLGPMAVTVGLFGVIFFLTGMSLGRQSGLSPEAVSKWKPDEGMLPEAGRFMFRVDVTLDEPIQTSILCGPCGNVEVQDGPRPSSYVCPKCDLQLWDEEE